MPVVLLQTKPVGVTAFALCKGWHWFPSLFTWLRRRLDRSIKSLRCNIKENNCYLSLTYIIESNPNQPESADKILTRKLNAFYFLEAELSKWDKNHVCDFLLEKLPVKSWHCPHTSDLALAAQGRKNNSTELRGSFFKTYASSKSLLHMYVVNIVFRIYQNTYLLLLEVSRQMPPLASGNSLLDAVAHGLRRISVHRVQHCTEFLLCSADQKLLRSYRGKGTFRLNWKKWKRILFEPRGKIK